MINTDLWTDRWVRSINPLDRLLFVYLLSNSHTNICGVYELSDDVMAFEVGLNIKDIHDAFLPRLAPKVYYKDGWVILPKFPKHQNIQSLDVAKGISREFACAPEHIQNLAKEVGWGDGLGIVPPSSPTKPNLTKPTVRANALPYDIVKEDSSLKGDSGDSKSPRISGDKRKAYDELIAWSEKERGFPFPKIMKLKQYRAFKLANENEIPRANLIERWEDMSTDKFWQKVGFDWMNVVQELLKKPV